MAVMDAEDEAHEAAAQKPAAAAPPATIHPAGSQRKLAALRREFEDAPGMETLLTRGSVGNIIDAVELVRYSPA